MNDDVFFHMIVGIFMFLFVAGAWTVSGLIAHTVAKIEYGVACAFCRQYIKLGTQGGYYDLDNKRLYCVMCYRTQQNFSKERIGNGK